jgi:hypothetical protein
LPAFDVSVAFTCNQLPFSITVPPTTETTCTQVGGTGEGGRGTRREERGGERGRRGEGGGREGRRGRVGGWREAHPRRCEERRGGGTGIRPNCTLLLWRGPPAS